MIYLMTRTKTKKRRSYRKQGQDQDPGQDHLLNPDRGRSLAQGLSHDRDQGPGQRPGQCRGQPHDLCRGRGRVQFRSLNPRRGR